MIAKLIRPLLWLLASFTIAAPLLAEPVKNPVTGIVYPDAVAGFKRLSYFDYEEKYPGQGLGYSYGYATPHAPTAPERITATVYAYTAGVKQIPDRAEHPLMNQLREQTLREIKVYAQRNNATLQPISSETLKVNTPKGPVSVLMDGFNVSQEGGPTNTWVWLWPARGQFMKIRITARGNVDKLPANAREFVEQMVRISAAP